MSRLLANPNTNVPRRIGAFFHCARCFDEWKAKVEGTENLSPADYQQIEAGWTEDGVQVWCKRHNINVIDITVQQETSQ